MVLLISGDDARNALCLQQRNQRDLESARTVALSAQSAPRRPTGFCEKGRTAATKGYQAFPYGEETRLNDFL
jgi:hypothetical protein